MLVPALFIFSNVLFSTLLYSISSMSILPFANALIRVSLSALAFLHVILASPLIMARFISARLSGSLLVMFKFELFLTNTVILTYFVTFTSG